MRVTQIYLRQWPQLFFASLLLVNCNRVNNKGDQESTTQFDPAVHDIMLDGIDQLNPKALESVCGQKPLFILVGNGESIGFEDYGAGISQEAVEVDKKQAEQFHQIFVSTIDKARTALIDRFKNGAAYNLKGNRCNIGNVGIIEIFDGNAIGDSEIKLHVIQNLANGKVEEQVSDLSWDAANKKIIDRVADTKLELNLARDASAIFASVVERFGKDYTQLNYLIKSHGAATKTPDGTKDINLTLFDGHDENGEIRGGLYAATYTAQTVRNQCSKNHESEFCKAYAPEAELSGVYSGTAGIASSTSGVGKINTTSGVGGNSTSGVGGNSTSGVGGNSTSGIASSTSGVGASTSGVVVSTSGISTSTSNVLGLNWEKPDADKVASLVNMKPEGVLTVGHAASYNAQGLNSPFIHELKFAELANNTQPTMIILDSCSQSRDFAAQVFDPSGASHRGPVVGWYSATSIYYHAINYASFDVLTMRSLPYILFWANLKGDRQGESLTFVTDRLFKYLRTHGLDAEPVRNAFPRRIVDPKKEYRTLEFVFEK